MAEAKFKPQYRRLLFIDEELRRGAYPNCRTLAAGWEVSPRTIQRDLDYLKYELGAPIEYDAVRHGFRYTDPAWFLPSIVLSEGDILGLLIGTQAAAMYRGTPIAEELRAIYRKLAALLPERISLPAELVCDRVSFVGPPARRIDPETWKCLLRGLMTVREVDVEYRAAHDGAARARTLRPYHLLNLEGEWYVLARDPAAQGVRQFAVSRIRSARLTARRFEVPAAFDAQALVHDRFGKTLHGGTRRMQRVRLRFAPEVAGYVEEKSWHAEQRLRRGRDGSLTLELPVPELRDLVPWILGFGALVEVLGPAALRRRLADEHAAAARLYRPRRGRRRTSSPRTRP